MSITAGGLLLPIASSSCVGWLPHTWHVTVTFQPGCSFWKPLTHWPVTVAPDPAVALQLCPVPDPVSWTGASPAIIQTFRVPELGIEVEDEEEADVEVPGVEDPQAATPAARATAKAAVAKSK